MATVTPNFNWPVPTSTDLVKDGATAIEALGDSIDASLVDLKGGTTGQVLSKASNTDLDYSWASPTSGDITGVTAGTGISGGGTSGDVTVTNSMATAIDAKGDLIAGTGADAFSRLPVGSDYLFLQALASNSNGLGYGGAYQTWTPTWVGVTVGNGTVVARYQRVANTIFYYIELTLGSTSSVTGEPRFSVPQGSANTLFFNGSSYYLDAGVQSANGSMELTSGYIYFRLTATSGTYANYAISLGPTTPWTWGTNDKMQAYGYYEVTP